MICCLLVKCNYGTYVDIITLWYMHAHTCTYITSHITYVSLCTYCKFATVNYLSAPLNPTWSVLKNLEMQGSGLLYLHKCIIFTYVVITLHFVV